MKRSFWYKPSLTFLLVFLFMPLLPVTVKAGEKPDFSRIDSLTYRLYLEKQWDSLILVGKQALHDDIDYYYLRIRMGIAYFEKQRYITSISHLTAALAFNKGDLVALEYLYFAYLYSNRPQDAYSLLPAMPETMKKRLNLKTPVIEQARLEAGGTFVAGENGKGRQGTAHTGVVYSETDRYGNSFYGQASLTFNLWNRASLKAAYSFLDFSKTRNFRWSLLSDNLVQRADCTWGYYNHYRIDTLYTDTTFKYQTLQNELFLEAKIVLPGRFRVQPSFHLLRVALPLVQAHYQASIVTDTLWYVASTDTYTTFPFARSIYTLTQNDTTFYNYVTGLTLGHDFSIFGLDLSGSWSNLNGKDQFQAGVSLAWFPAGNLNIYGNTAVTGFFQGRDTRLLFSQMVGGRIAPWCWVEGTFYYGDYTNANLFNGAVVYNNSDKIKYRLNAQLIFLLSKNLQLSVIYQYARKEYQELLYEKTADPVTGTISVTSRIADHPYSANTLIGGLTWKL